MQISNCINVTETLEEGRKLYGRHILSFMKYALLSVMVSHLVSIYVAIFDTFFTKYLLIYVLGLVFLLLLYFPIVYYSILITITNAEKLKRLYKGETYDYRKGLRSSRDKFWRVFFVMFVRFILKLVVVFSLMIPILYFVGRAYPDLFAVVIKGRILPVAFMGAFLAFLLGVYFLIRTEFASFIIYWDIKVIGNEFKTSMLLTKKDFFQKLKVIIVAYLPGLILSVSSLTYIFMNLEDIHPMVRWVYIGITMGLNLFLYTWRYAFYYPLLNQMECIVEESKTTVDNEGREWLSF